MHHFKKKFLGEHGHEPPLQRAWLHYHVRRFKFKTTLFTQFFYALRRRGPHNVVCLRAPTIVDPSLYATISHSYGYDNTITHQLGPRYEGQLMSDGGAYSNFRSILLVLTHDFIITCVYGPTGSDGHEWIVPTRMLRCAPFLCRLRRRDCCMLGVPSSQPTVPLHELPPASLVIHRQTSAHGRRKWTRSVQSRSGILAYLCTGQHWLWITVELHIPARATERLLLGREVAMLLFAEFWARNHYALERIDIVVGHGRSGVPLTSTRLHQ